MSNYDRNAAAPGFSANDATAIDAGLRSFMLRVYNYVAAGVGLTSVAAFLTYQFTGPELLQSQENNTHSHDCAAALLFRTGPVEQVDWANPIAGCSGYSDRISPA